MGLLGVAAGVSNLGQKQRAPQTSRTRQPRIVAAAPLLPLCGGAWRAWWGWRGGAPNASGS